MTVKSAALLRSPNARRSAWACLLGLIAICAAAAAAAGPAARQEIPLRLVQYSGPGFPGGGAWVDASDGAVPPGAVRGGHEAAPDREPLFLCRALIDNSLQPGKVRPGLGACYIPFGGAEVTRSHYQVLVGGGFGWVPGTGSLPGRAVQGGYDVPPQSPPLFICQAPYNGGVHPGKIRPDWNSCDISWGGREVFVQTYAVLVR